MSTIEELERRIEFLERKLATMADPDEYRDHHALPIDAVQPRPQFPAATDGVVHRGPLIVVDPAYDHDRFLQRMMMLRMDFTERSGPATGGDLNYYGGRAGSQKLFAPGGLVLTSLNDTPEVALIWAGWDPVTGRWLGEPSHHSAIGRVYDTFWQRLPSGIFVMSARTVDMVWCRNLLDIRVTNNVDIVNPLSSLKITGPENLRSGRTGLHIGFLDIDKTTKELYRNERMVRLRRISDVIKPEHVKPEYQDYFMLMISHTGDDGDMRVRSVP